MTRRRFVEAVVPDVISRFSWVDAADVFTVAGSCGVHGHLQRARKGGVP